MSDPTLSLRRRLLLVATAAGLATALAVPAGTAQAAPKDSRFTQVNVVSDQPGKSTPRFPRGEQVGRIRRRPATRFQHLLRLALGILLRITIEKDA